VSVDRAAAYEMIQRSGQQGVPVITVDDQVVVGFDRKRLQLLLSQAGTAGTPRPSLGAAVADASKMLMQRGQIPVFGALVGKVSPKTPAEQIGLQPGDIITQVGVRPVRGADDVETALSGVQHGATLDITYSRGDRVLRGKARF